MKEFLELFTTFFRIGATTFGGGYAMLPIIQHEIVEKKGWATEEEIMDYYAVGQCTPGIIAINTSTFIGQKLKGVAGGVVATLGFTAPSIIIITIIAMFLQNFAHLALVKNAFAGIRVCVCVLILNATIKLWKKAVTDKLSFLIFLAVMAAMVFLSPSPVILVLIGGIAGIIIKSLQASRQNKGRENGGDDK